jgi:hypothetical protein
VDWYPTFCYLSGSTNCSDDSRVKPRSIDPSRPGKDIYGKQAFPGLDGKNVWHEIQAGRVPLREYLWLSSTVLIKGGKYKLVTAQQEPRITASPPMTGWRQPDGTWVDGGALDGSGCGVAFKNRSNLKPCLFDLEHDEREEHDLSAEMPELMREIWAELNRTQLTAFSARTPRKMLGTCRKACADKKWTHIYGGGRSQGPICGVPGCV